jgi:hypothetical protein
LRTAYLFLNTFSLIGVIFLNALAGSGALSERNVGEVSRIYDTLFAPAGYAFSIWGLIYLMLIGFVGFQWYGFINKKYEDVISQTGIWFVISNIANASWLFLWVNEMIGLSVIVMMILLVSLIIITVKLRLEIWNAPFKIIAFVWWPFAIYLGWVIVASVANIAAFLVSLEWDGNPLSPKSWTIIMIIIATGVFTFLIFNRNLRESAAVGIWAFTAIVARQGYENLEITVTAILASVILLGIILYHAYQNRDTSPLKKLL